MEGTRCVDNTPLNTPKNTTILSSIRLNGETAYTIYQGGTTRNKFVDYLSHVLAPTLQEGDIVIMDNLQTHHANAVKEVIENLNIKVMYLPPYSPDLNPIEKMWSKIKSILRKRKVRDFHALSKAIAYAFSKVCALDCSGWFRSCGIV